MNSIHSPDTDGALETDLRGWTPPDPETTRKLATLIKDIRIAMLTTVCADGSLRSRPMATQEPGFEEGELWFFTADDSPKTAEIACEHEVNLAYAEPKDQRYISLSGTAALVRDPVRARRLWQPAMMAWFPAGPDDPHLTLLRVRVHTAEYWDAPGGRMASLFARAKSALAGGRPLKDAGEHARVNFYV